MIHKTVIELEHKDLLFVFSQMLKLEAESLMLKESEKDPDGGYVEIDEIELMGRDEKYSSSAIVRFGCNIEKAILDYLKYKGTLSEKINNIEVAEDGNLIVEVIMTPKEKTDKSVDT